MSNEPGQIVAGDSVDWTENLNDYPAPDWVLHYALFNKDGNYSFDAGADGTGHKAALTAATTAATTAAWAAGRYDWASYVTKGAERESVATGAIIIKAHPAAGVPLDGRTHARKMLDALEATLEGKATTQDLDLVKGQFGERAMERDPELLRKWRDHYRTEVQDEEDKAAMKAGKKRSRNIKMKFTRP